MCCKYSVELHCKTWWNIFLVVKRYCHRALYPLYCVVCKLCYRYIIPIYQNRLFYINYVEYNNINDIRNIGRMKYCVFFERCSPVSLACLVCILVLRPTACHCPAEVINNRYSAYLHWHTFWFTILHCRCWHTFWDTTLHC